MEPRDTNAGEIKARAKFRILIACLLIGLSALACGSSFNREPTAGEPTVEGNAPDSSASYSAFSAQFLNEEHPPAELHEGLTTQAAWDDYSRDSSFRQLAKSLGPDTQPTVACLTDDQADYICQAQIEFFNLTDSFSMAGLQESLSKAFSLIKTKIVWLDPDEYPGNISPANVDLAFLTTSPLDEETFWIIAGYRIPEASDRAYVMLGEFDSMFSTEDAWEITSSIIEDSVIRK